MIGRYFFALQPQTLPGLRALQDESALTGLLDAVLDARAATTGDAGEGPPRPRGLPVRLVYWSVGFATPDSSDQSSTPLFLR